MYKIAIVEDEEKQVQKIKKYLHQYEKEKLVDCCRRNTKEG